MYKRYPGLGAALQIQAVFYGKGKRKSVLQQLHEELEQCGKRLMEYKECFEIMGKILSYMDM